MQPSSCTIQAEPDDVIVVDSPEAVARLNAEIDRVQAHNRRVLRRLTPQGRRAFATYIRTRTVPTPMRARTAPRSRGAGRPAVRRSAQRTSAKSGDSDAGDAEPGEPWALTWFDRAPVVWRLRAARCRLLEIREGVDR